MPADLARCVFDQRVASLDVHPAGMNPAGGVEDAGFGDRRMHADEILVVDAEIGPERPVERIRRLLLVEVPGLVLPQALGADAVLVPALHRAAGARSLVGFA